MNNHRDTLTIPKSIPKHRVDRNDSRKNGINTENNNSTRFESN